MAFATWTPPRPPQLGSGKEIESLVLRAGFGDQYEQVASDGINSEREKATWIWNGCPDADADSIETFYRLKGSHTPFWYKPPGASAPILWRFDSFRRTQIAGAADSIEIAAHQVFDQDS